MTDFSHIISELDANGYYWSKQSTESGLEQLVCVSHRESDGRLHGNSFWIVRRGETWILGTWLNYVYRVSNESEVPSLCIAAIRLSTTPIYRLPAETIEKYRLIESCEYI